MTVYQGAYLMGTCVGFAEEAWARNGKSGVNYRVGISRTYQDKYGNPVTETIDADVANDAVAKIRNQVAMLRGQPVMVRFVPIAKVGGRSGAFVTYFIPNDADLIPQQATKPASDIPFETLQGSATDKTSNALLNKVRGDKVAM